MELRTYWTIIWRRIWLVALIVGVVALYAGYQFYHLRKTASTLTTYSSTVTVQIGIQTKGAPTNIVANTATAEAFADTLATGPILTSNEFDTQVSNQIAADSSQISQHYGAHPDLGNWNNAGAIGASLSATRAHTLVTISVTWGTPAGAWAIANASGEVITANAGKYFDYLITSTSTNSPISATTIARVTSNASAVSSTAGSITSKEATLLLLLLVALVIGIALAFLLDYLDDRIRSKDEVVNLLQLPVVGEIPRAPEAGRTRSLQKPQIPAA